jgi:heavy metal sensor kinase
MTLRLRLTLWYSLLLAVTLIAFAFVSFEEMRRILLSSVDTELRSDLTQTKQLVASAPCVRCPALFAVLARHDSDIFEIESLDGKFKYASGAAARAREMPMRDATTTVNARDGRYRIRFALPLLQYESAVEQFGFVTFISIPIVLLVAAGGGMWMSRRALQPVDRVIREAREINEQNLDRRLPLPRSRDELYELSQTFNEMLDRLERSFRRIAEFTADASHELRTPVALLRASADVALRNPRTADEYHDTLASILAESERMTILIEDLLALARSDSEMLPKERLDLAEPLREAIVLNGAPAPPPALPHVFIDGNRAALQRLFMALLDNAIKYTPSGDISVELTAGATVIIRDGGIGIAAADLPHVFERFYRGDKSRSRASGGSGLGLAIARRIAELHGGTITATSVEGRGSEFRVTLPARMEGAC